MSTTMEIEAAVREGLARVLESPAEPAGLDPDLDMADDTKVSLSVFTEPDVAGMRTLRDVITALARHAAKDSVT